MVEALAIGFFVILFGGIIGTSMYQSKKRKEASWSGVVMDKNIKETVHRDRDNYSGGSGFSFGRRESSVTRNYTIKVKTDTGEELNWPISSGMYDTLNIGDRLVKNPGTETPEITDKVSAPVAEAASAEVKPGDNNTTPPIVPTV